MRSDWTASLSSSVLNMPMLWLWTSVSRVFIARRLRPVRSAGFFFPIFAFAADFPFALLAILCLL